jgi:hypothetical protein
MNITRRTLALIALLSGLATALVVHAGVAGTQAQQDALAALKHPATVTAVQRGETLVAIAPRTTTAPAPRNISPPASDASSGSAHRGGSTTAGGPSPTTSTTTTATTPTNLGLPKIGHIFVVSLSTPSLEAAFGRASSATYLRSLLHSGTLLTGYRSLGHGELADQLALLSGQAPNPDTTAGCPRYVAFPDDAAPNRAGLVGGRGCVYPSTALTLADQVTNSGRQWGAYVEGMGSTPCPTPQTGGTEDSAIPGVDAGYDTLHNPFIFFPSLTGSGDCYLDEGDTDTRLAPLLQRSVAATPALTYLAPDACADGALSDRAGTTTTTAATTTTGTPTTDGLVTTTTAVTSTTAAPAATTAETATTTAAATTPATVAATTSATAATTTAASATTAGRDDYCAAGQASGITAEDQFLASWVPLILASKAYKVNGVLVIAFSGVTPKRGSKPFSTGALVISRWTTKGKRILTAYDPYSLLHSLEDMLDLQPLANATEAPEFAKRVL